MKKFLHSTVLFGAAQFKKISKNINFSLHCERKTATISQNLIRLETDNIYLSLLLLISGTEGQIILNLADLGLVSASLESVGATLMALMLLPRA